MSFEADLSRTSRHAVLDEGPDDPSRFARKTIASAREAGERDLVWHFAAKSVVERLRGQSPLGRIATQLVRDGKASSRGLTVWLATRRIEPSAGFRSPLACWWASDDRLLKLDSTHRSRIDALVSGGERAPIWLTAFALELGDELIGVRRAGWRFADQDPGIEPIEVEDDLRQTIADFSSAMTLSTNGIHDSLAGPLVDYARQEVRSGRHRPETIAVAALQVGWWPKKVPGLLKRIA